MNCSLPPEKPPSGTWEWDGAVDFRAEVLYTCGPYGRFLQEDGDQYQVCS